MAAGPRYAVYFTPAPDSELWRFGSGVIGYDADRGRDLEPACPPGFDAVVWAAHTDEPRRYGFHATLKAPFHLCSDRTEAELLGAIDRLAAELAPPPPFALEASLLGRFVALTISGDQAPVGALAGRVVEALDPFRAPLGAADRARRLASPLTARQIELLDRWGYPYVMEQFRFHMTLTGALPAEIREPVRAALAAAFAAAVPAGPAATIEALTVLRQDSRAGRFRIIERRRLTGDPPALPAPP